MNNHVSLYFLVFCLSLVINQLALYLLEKYKVVDVPNSRSMHAHPVPRGGGIAIACVLFVPFGYFQLFGEHTYTWIVLGCSIMALGALDDFRPLGMSIRLLCQIVIAFSLTCAFLLPSTTIIDFRFVLLSIFIIFSIVWMINSFNFMDGADGFAVTQAVFFFASLGLIALIQGLHLLSASAFVSVAVVLGFAPGNWHPAKVFMGDSGSYFLGFLVASVTLCGWLEGLSPLSTLILIAPFLVDSSLTLIKRVSSGENFFAAHREHCYQKLLLNGWSPSKLCFVLVFLLSVVCLPGAVLSVLYWESAAFLTCLVYGFFSALWYYVSRISSNGVL